MSELKNHTYRVTLPDGTVLTRTTKRVYTHVIVWQVDLPHNNRVDSWAGRPDLAEKKAARNIHLFAFPVDNPRTEVRYEVYAIEDETYVSNTYTNKADADDHVFGIEHVFAVRPARNS